MSRFVRYIRPYVRTELLAANACATREDFAASFRHLERAHILGQASTRYHVWVHWRMLLWALQQRRPQEIAGQIFRIYCAAMVTVMGLVPRGNTGGSNVCPFQRMPISEDLSVLLENSPKSWVSQYLAIFLFTAKTLLVAALAVFAVPDTAGTAVIDDRHIAFRVVGSGLPAIVMISGLGDGMATYDDIASELGKTNAVIIYDRAGYGGSSSDSSPRDAVAAERELSGLLVQSGIAGPYVLSGHSLGGLFAEYYASKHPEQVSGLILEDSRAADFSRQCVSLLGAGNCLPPAWARWFMAKGARAEALALEQTVAQVDASMPLRGTPVLVLSRANKDGSENSFDALWAQSQENLAARYPGSRHLTATAGGHYLHRDQHDWFLESIRQFLVTLR